MMEPHKYARCAICGKFGYVNSHRCNPEWEWRSDDIFSAGEWCNGRVRARDAEDAALAAGESYDEGEYTLVRGGEATIWVRQIGTTEISKWTVTAESVPQYYAREAEDDDGAELWAVPEYPPMEKRSWVNS